MTLDRIFEGISRLFSLETWSGVAVWMERFLGALAPYSTVLSLLFLTGIVYCFLRYEQIVEETYHDDRAHGGGHGHPEGEGGAQSESEEPPAENKIAKRFAKVLEHGNSARESDWRLAILEADVLLDEMVTGMGYHGDSLGEKLKAIEKSDFLTLDKAWEAHAVRNRIAHEGAAFVLSAREAKRVIALYEEVFKEFRYI